MKPINGKIYPLWGQFVDLKEEWIGGTMQEFDSHCGPAPVTTIKDIRMEPNGETSAMFYVTGEEYEWCADVEILTIDSHTPVENGICLCTTIGSFGSRLEMKKPTNQQSLAA